MQDPQAVRHQVLHVALAEVARDFVERRVGLGRVPRVVDFDLIEDRGVPRVIECLRSLIRSGLAPAKLVEQRRKAQLVESRRQLVQPRQPPRRVLVGRQRCELPGEVIGRQPDAGAQCVKFPRAFSVKFG